MLSRLVKNQLKLFVLVTVAALLVMAANYVRVPEMLGIGRYELRVQLAETGGLYPRSVVTYRGHEIGTVEKINLRGTSGVEAIVSVDNGTTIPVDTKVEVRSASVIGEQYLNFEPKVSGTSRSLKDGDIVPASAATIPVSTSQLLANVDDFLQSIPVADLRTTINELGTAFSGDGGDLGRLIDQASSFQTTATANLGQTLSLIRQLAPVLATQQQIGPDFRSWTTHLASLADQVAASDDSVRALLSSSQPLAAEAQKSFEGLQPLLPSLLTDLNNTSQVLRVYLPSLQHLLVVFPASLEALMASVPQSRRNQPITEVNLSFKGSVNSPPICTTGFAEAGKQRDPQDLSYAPPPADSYCKVAPGDPRVPRGARNQLCPNVPVRHSPTAAGCGLIFQKDVVAAQRAASSEGIETAVYDDETGRLIAPNGQFYLLDAVTRVTPYTTFNDMMKRLTAP